MGFKTSALDLREDFFNYAKLHSKYEKLQKDQEQIEKLYDQKRTVLSDLFNEKMEIRSSWYGFYGNVASYFKHDVTSIDEEDQGCSHDLLESLMSPIRKINNIAGRLNLLESEICTAKGSLMYEYERLNSVNTQIKQLNPEVQRLSTLTTQPHNVLELIKLACGGHEAFESLPVLKIQHRMIGPNRFIDFIKQNDLTAPVMRFTDDIDRKGIVLRVQDKNGKFLVQSFFQANTYDGNWNTGGQEIIPTNTRLVQSGVIDTKSYENLKSLLTTGRCKIGNQTYNLA